MLSRSLGLCTVAEAVETVEQVEALRAIGVDVAQGYFFSPPMAAEEAQGFASGEAPPSFDLTQPREVRAGGAARPEAPVEDRATAGPPRKGTGRARR